jgi:hypothetical protein
MEESKSMAEIRVKLSNDDQKYQQDFLCYDAFQVHPHDPVIREFVEQAQASFKAPVLRAEIRIVISL